MMQLSFSSAEYAAKKKRTRRDRFLAQIEAVTSWSVLIEQIEPFYPKGEGRCRPSVGLSRILRMRDGSRDLSCSLDANLSEIPTGCSFEQLAFCVDGAV
jgi:hypothetical protein